MVTKHLCLGQTDKLSTEMLKMYLSAKGNDAGNVFQTSGPAKCLPAHGMCYCACVHGTTRECVGCYRNISCHYMCSNKTTIGLFIPVCYILLQFLMTVSHAMLYHHRKDEVCYMS